MACNLYTSLSYGISDQHPLGEFEKLESVLTKEVNLIKNPISRLPSSDIPPMRQMYKYHDPTNEYEYVVLLLDNQNTLRGIAGWYITPAVGGTRSRVRAFMRQYWTVCGGPKEPQFTQFKLGRFTRGETNFAKGQVKGQWQTSKDEGGSVPEPTYERIYVRVD